MFYDFWKKRKLTRFGNKIVESVNFKITKIIYKFFKNKKYILEIGPGKGCFLKYISKYNYYYTAIEPNKNLAKQCKGINKKAVIINAFIPPIKLKNNTFDIVYMSHVLEHFSDHKEVLKVLKDIHRILKTDGSFVLFFPDYLSFKADFFDSDYSHEYITTMNRIKYLLQDTNFKIIKKIHFRGNFSGISRILLTPFFFINKLIFSVLYSLFNIEMFLKAKITFGRNILVISKKV